MVQICNYSTLIISGNITVLLIVSILTDHWIYRGFKFENLKKDFRLVPDVFVRVPRDTKSFIEIVFATKQYRYDLKFGETVVHYLPPLYIDIWMNGTVDMDNVMMITHVVLFQQYGNIYRQCDDLEDGVRTELGMKAIRPEKCTQFLLTPLYSNTGTDLGDPAVLYLEIAAFTSAVFSIVCIMTSLVAGSVGSFSGIHGTIMLASGSALLAGITLIITIALFNGKCHLQRRREPLSDFNIPYKEILIRNRTYSYNWSFVLAWICVALIFCSSFAWLYKAQDLIDVDPKADQEVELRFVKNPRRKLNLSLKKECYV